jgi:hypothetical protein
MKFADRFLKSMYGMAGPNIADRAADFSKNFWPPMKAANSCVGDPINEQNTSSFTKVQLASSF